LLACVHCNFVSDQKLPSSQIKKAVAVNSAVKSNKEKGRCRGNICFSFYLRIFLNKNVDPFQPTLSVIRKEKNSYSKHGYFPLILFYPLILLTTSSIHKTVGVVIRGVSSSARSGF